ncbi:hypothetical protein V1318_13180 [Lysobacter sp. CCNWLW3]|uniref:hypothetical protein n=1 Tax=unclassified Lysobacter TaxID=2635362 RepID=UPI002FD2DDF0
MTTENLRVDMLERMRDRVESHDKAGNIIINGDALLEAISTAATLALPMPVWLASAVTGAIAAYKNYDVRTLDEAFGVERPKGKRQDAERKERASAIYVIAEVLRLHHVQKVPISVEIFEIAGETCGVKKTTAENWFYNHKNARSDIYVVAMQMAGVTEG